MPDKKTQRPEEFAEEEVTSEDKDENQVEMNSIRRNCEPIKEMGQDFGLCQQGCEANLPKKMTSFVPKQPKNKNLAFQWLMTSFIDLYV